MRISVGAAVGIGGPGSAIAAWKCDATTLKAGQLRQMANNPLAQQMRAELTTEDGRSLYRMRQAVVEPVFGSIKELRCFRRFKLRGLNRVRAEWQIICTTHNLLKLFRHHWKTAIA